MNVKIESDNLVNKYSEYVVKIVQQIKKNLHPNIEIQDLISYGMMGLIEASQRFDPSLGVAFSTYSYYRIKGAIYDGLRCMGSLSRTEYRKYTLNSGYCIPKISDQNVFQSISLVSLDNEDINSIHDDKLQHADELVLKLQLYEKMRKAIGNLSKKEQDIINLYYFEELSLEEVGNKVGLSKSWISRKHAQVLEKLSNKFLIMLNKDFN